MTPQTQIERVRDALLAAARQDAWLTLDQLAGMTGDGEASVSAQIRNLRKPQFGAYRVAKRWRADGHYEYQLRTDE